MKRYVILQDQDPDRLAETINNYVQKPGFIALTNLCAHIHTHIYPYGSLQEIHYYTQGVIYEEEEELT